jgi:S23 ribosomal protein.
VPLEYCRRFAKSSEKDFARFLEISLGSLLELETELIVSFNLEYVDSIRFNEIQVSLIELQKMISGFKKHLDKE